MMRTALRTFAGIVAFTLPILVSVIGVRFDHSVLGHDPKYTGWIAVVLWSSIGLGALGPAALILTSKLSWPKRIGLTCAILCLFVLECVFTFYIAMMSEVG
jgi:hypothetical protein